MVSTLEGRASAPKRRITMPYLATVQGDRFMSLDKGVAHGKEQRKPYQRSSARSPDCRPGGCCPWCRGNRTLRDRREEEFAHDQLEDEARLTGTSPTGSSGCNVWRRLGDTSIAVRGWPSEGIARGRVYGNRHEHFQAQFGSLCWPHACDRCMCQRPELGHRGEVDNNHPCAAATGLPRESGTSISRRLDAPIPVSSSLGAS
jgi:hypothetical protein